MGDLFKRDYFEDLFDSVTLGFGRPFNIKFNTPYTKDMCPASPWTKNEDGSYSTVVRVLGINEEDLKVELKDFGLSVSGESEIFNGKYSQHVDLSISSNIISDIKEINYELKNGLCKINLIMEEPKFKEVKINQIR